MYLDVICQGFLCKEGGRGHAYKNKKTRWFNPTLAAICSGRPSVHLVAASSFSAHDYACCHFEPMGLTYFHLQVCSEGFVPVLLHRETSTYHVSCDALWTTLKPALGSTLRTH